VTDEELPDYIMVMVANKRSREQMEDDLQLFLGSNTEEFTGWLHQVLQKLQEVTVASLGESYVSFNTLYFRVESVDTLLHIRGLFNMFAVHIKF
jgi:hypothetical protein